MAFSQFVFAMTDALVDQLISRFSVTPWSPLNQNEIDAQIPVEDRSAKGVYLLGSGANSDIVAKYVGQSNSAIYDRLSRHAKFLQDRYGLPYEKICFKALGVIIFDSVALEERLINRFRTKWNKDDYLSGWNGSGIGSNDTGGGRDKQKPSGFDKRFPIDINIMKRGLLVPGQVTAKQLFIRLKSMAPYTIRTAPSSLGLHADLQDSQVHVSEEDASVLQVLRMMLDALPNAWSIQVNPVRVLLQHDVEPAPGALINPESWPPKAWLAGQDPTVILRSGG